MFVYVNDNHYEPDEDFHLLKQMHARLSSSLYLLIFVPYRSQLTWLEA